MNLKYRVMSGIRWRGGSNLLSQLFTWGFTVLIMRILSPEDYGLLAMAGVSITFFGLISELGLGPAIIQNKNMSEYQLRQILGITIIVNSAIAIMLFLLAPIISNYFNDHRLVWLIRVMSIQFIPSAFIVIPQSILTRKLDYKALSIVDFTASIITSIITLGLATAGFGVWAIVGGMLFNVAIRTIGVNIICPFLKMPSFSFAGTRKMLVYGGNITVSRLLWTFYTQSDVLLAGKFFSSQLLGYYSVSMYLARMPLDKIAGIINHIAFPAFAEVQHNIDNVQMYFLKAVRMLSLFAFPILWGISSISHDLIIVFLGSKWEPASLPLQLITIIMPFSVINNVLNPLIQGIGRPEITVKNLAWASIIMPLAFLLGINWGLKGLCVAWILGFPLVFLGNLSRLLPVIGLKIKDVTMQIAGSVLAGLAMYLIVYIIGEFILVQIESKIKLIVMVACGAFTYVLAIRLFAQETYVEVVALVRGT